MRKVITILVIIIIFLFVPYYLASNIIQEYYKEYIEIKSFFVEKDIDIQVKEFNISSVKVKLESDIRYCFIFSGESDFHVQFIVPSGNKWDMYDSENKKMIFFKDISHKGTYTFWVYSMTNNKIKLIVLKNERG